ncbi:hypothetical protein NliqN6_5298 [Naganishia liquefaciens]|uniref:Uncharacterized protein n=1 Tax=Naganishia liquefaciens TaxID=104408 RepID=A0A8H3TXU4_9TREE|nr:hypothetical protein NliqN6_5298 [Naganishia liquefaciens]
MFWPSRKIFGSLFLWLGPLSSLVASENLPQVRPLSNTTAPSLLSKDHQLHYDIQFPLFHYDAFVQFDLTMKKRQVIATHVLPTDQNSTAAPSTAVLVSDAPAENSAFPHWHDKETIHRRQLKLQFQESKVCRERAMLEKLSQQAQAINARLEAHNKAEGNRLEQEAADLRSQARTNVIQEAVNKATSETLAQEAAELRAKTNLEDKRSEANLQDEQKNRAWEEALERREEKYRAWEEDLERREEKHRTWEEDLERREGRNRALQEDLERREEKNRASEEGLKQQEEKNGAWEEDLRQREAQLFEAIFATIRAFFLSTSKKAATLLKTFFRERIATSSTYWMVRYKILTFLCHASNLKPVDVCLWIRTHFNVKHIIAGARSLPKSIAFGIPLCLTLLLVCLKRAISSVLRRFLFAHRSGKPSHEHNDLADGRNIDLVQRNREDRPANGPVIPRKRRVRSPGPAALKRSMMPKNCDAQTKRAQSKIKGKKRKPSKIAQVPV